MLEHIPMSKPVETDAAGSTALLLWVLRNGPAQLRDVVRTYIRYLQQVLFPRVSACLKQLPALTPIWQRARAFVVTFVHAQVIEYCRAFVAAWVKRYHKLRQSLGSSQPQKPQAVRKDEFISATQEQSKASRSGKAEEATILAQHSSHTNDSTTAASPTAAEQPAEATSSCPKTEATSSSSGAEASSSSPEAKAASSSPEAEAASNSPKAEAASSSPGTEAASNSPEAEAASNSPKAEAASSSPEAEVATSSPGAEAASNSPKAEAVCSTPGAEAARNGPEAEAASSSPEAEVASSTPGAEAASNGPEAETASSSPEAEAASNSPKAKAASSSPEAEAASNSPKIEAASSSPKGDNSGSPCPTQHTTLNSSCPAVADNDSAPSSRQSAVADRQAAAVNGQAPAAGAHAAVASGNAEIDIKDSICPTQHHEPESAPAGNGAKSCLSPEANGTSGVKLPKEEDVQIEAGQQQLHTPPRRERLQGSWSTAAAWLQSQATSAAALSASNPLSTTSATASSVSIVPPSSFSFKQPVFSGKHRRHASTAAFTIPDQDLASSPQIRASLVGLSGAAPETASSSSHSEADLTAAHSSEAGRAADDKSAMSAPVSGQESLDKAAAALKSLQDKFGQKKRKEDRQASPKLQSRGHVIASSGGGLPGFSQDLSSGASTAADMDSSRPSNRATAVPSTKRSSFDFKLAVGGKTVLAGKSADDNHHVGSVTSSMVKQDGGHRRSNEEEHSALSSHNQAASAVQPILHPAKQKKCRPLQISGESAQAMDPYNLQSPGLVLLDQALTPDELERRNDSYNLALKQRGVTLKPWSSQHAGQQDSGHAQNSPDLPDPSLDVVSDGQVLEGQGRGQFLGPPAQRWAIGSALKDSINRLPSVPEEFENSMDEEGLAQPPSHAHGLPFGAQGAATGRDSIDAHLLASSVHSRPKRHVTFAVSNRQDSFRDQENVQA